MLTFLPGIILGIISTTLFFINTIILTTILQIFAFIKFIIPIKIIKKQIDKILIFISNAWIFFNNMNIIITKKIKWEITGLEKVKMDEWYLVISNHQTWVDIIVLQKVFLRKIPFLKFFLKKELIWVPILGPAWWALDFPFMKRYSKEFIEKNPHLKGKDIEITKKACEKFKTNPISIMNFLEGTRFSQEKHDRQESPYKHLLKPKSGGVAFALDAMGDLLTNIVNVTIHYPDGPMTFWEFLCGKINHVKINIEVIPITDDLKGDYENDPVFKEYFQSWISKLWVEKDECLDGLKK